MNVSLARIELNVTSNNGLLHVIPDVSNGAFLCNTCQ